MGAPDTPRKTADLYALDSVLWGTVSEEVRDTPEEIYDYFVSERLRLSREFWSKILSSHFVEQRKTFLTSRDLLSSRAISGRLHMRHRTSIRSFKLLRDLAEKVNC